MRRGLAAATGLAALAVLLPSAQGHLPPRPGRPCPGKTDAVLVSGAWKTIKSPLPSVTGHATGGLDGKRVLVTDGRRIQRSSDGGCTWHESYDAGAASIAGVTPSVDAVTFVGRRAFALVAGVGRVAASRVLASDDGGVTWHGSSTGLPATADFRELVGKGDRLYLTTTLADATGDLYTSANGGRSWARAASGDPILRLALDPLDPRTLYVVRTTHAIERSTDGGTSFTALKPPVVPDSPFDPSDLNSFDPAQPNRNGSWRDIAVAHRRGKEAVIVVAAAPSAAATVTRIVASNDSGHSFRDLPTDGLGPIGGLGFGNAPGQILFASGSTSTAFHGAGLLAFDLGYQVWRDIDDLELGSMREQRSVRLSAAARGHRDYDDVELRRDAAGKPDLIVRYTPPDPPPGGVDLNAKGPCGEGIPTGGPSTVEQEERGVSFAPESLDLSLTPGQPRRVALAARLGPVPSPLDVYFLIDSSESMDPAIDGVKCSAKRIVNQLFARGIDAWFGLGTYNDRYDTRYERRLDLEPPGPGLGKALDHLFTRRGKEEPIRTALMQSATGAGLSVHDGNGPNGPITVTVPPGQQADYRSDALHTVIVIGDEPYEETTPGEPSAANVISALRRKGVLALGVQVVPPFFQPINTRDDGRLAHRQLILRQQLENFARGSGALAPPGGVDCDGGGAPDVAAGQPLVCSVSQTGIQQSMSDTLVALLGDLRDVGDVRIVPRRTSGLDVAMEGASAARVDLHQPSQLAGAAVVTCGPELRGQRVPLSFAVEVGSRVVGELAGAATCGSKPAPAGTPPPHRPAPARPHHPAPAAVPVAQAASQPAAVPPPPPGPAPQPAVAVPAPPAPPTPALVPGASAQAQAAASSASGATATAPAPGAMAAAPEAAPATRPVAARVETDPDAYALSAARASRAQAPLPAAAAITLGLGICGGFGWLVVAADRRRTRPRPALSPLRRAR